MTTGTIVGIVVAAVLVIGVIILLALLRRYRKWPFHKRAPLNTVELDADGNAIGHEKDGRAIGTPGQFGPPGNLKVEADSKTDLAGYYRPELAGSAGHPTAKNELPGVAVQRPDGERSTGELYGSHAASEVEGSRVIMELAGSPVGSEYYRPRGSGSSAVSREPSPATIGQSADGRPGHRSERLGSTSSPLSPDSAGRISRSPQSPSWRSPDGLSAGARSGRSPMSPERVEEPVSREVSGSRSRPGTGYGR